MSIRAIGIVVVLVAAGFGGGYLVGSGKVDTAKEEARAMMARAESFRTQLEETRVHTDLVEAMAGLREVALDVSDNNFGNARQVMGRVRETVQRAYEHAAGNETLRASLASVQQRLAEIDADLRTLDASAREKIDALVVELRRIVGQ